MDPETIDGVQRTERGGIPVWWADAPGAFTATLAFRVGVADEVLANHGITHFVEHVALSTLGRREHQWNGSVDGTTCVFWAEGDREEVLEYLRLVGAALADLPEDRIDIERRVLRAEADRDAPGVVARMLDYRFGSAGFGLVNHLELGLRWLRAGDLRRWSAERFTRGNAALWMSGEPPQELDLGLPDGPRHPVPTPQPLALRYPAYVEEGTGGVALTGLGQRSTALRVAMAIASERLYDAVRRERGLAYGPTGGYVELDPQLGHAFLGSDCNDEDAEAVLAELYRTVLEMAEHGATEEELERHRRQALKGRDDPARIRYELNYQALGALTGEPVLSDEEFDRELEALDPAAVAAAMDLVKRSAVVLGPEGCPPPDPSMSPTMTEPEPPVEDGETFVAPGRRRLLRGRTGGAELRVSERGVTIYPEGEEPATIVWAQCEAAVRLPAGELSLHQRDGRWLEIAPPGWEDGERVLERVAELVPEGRIVPACDRELFEAIERAASARLKPDDAVRHQLNEISATLATGEELLDLASAVRRATAGLLVLTHRRVLWLNDKEEPRFEVAVDTITNADASGDQLDFSWDGGSAKFTIQPREAAEALAEEIRARRD